MSKRLNNSERHTILSELINVYDAKNKKIKEKISDELIRLNHENLPDVIKNIIGTEHEKYLKYMTSIYLYDLKIKNLTNTTLYLKRPVVGKNDADNGIYNFISKTQDISQLRKLLDELSDGMTERYNMYNDIQKCLYSIRTPNVLKNEFPEAYKIYCEKFSDVVAQNSCDSIEKIRAKLNSNK